MIAEQLDRVTAAVRHGVPLDELRLVASKAAQLLTAISLAAGAKGHPLPAEVDAAAHELRRWALQPRP